MTMRKEVCTCFFSQISDKILFVLESEEEIDSVEDDPVETTKDEKHEGRIAITTPDGVYVKDMTKREDDGHEVVLYALEKSLV